MSGLVDTMQWAVAELRPEVTSLGAMNAVTNRLQRLWLGKLSSSLVCIKGHFSPECVISDWKGAGHRVEAGTATWRQCWARIGRS